jgi:tetratricopeptide (TPR) repeat protein
MKSFAVLLLCMWVAGCATVPAPRMAVPQGLFDDRLFGAPSEAVTGDDVFVVSDEMRRFLENEIAADVRVKGHRQALFDALYTKNRLQLNYDGTSTRGAAPTFAARSGNCLSLVLMTSAFAKAMDLPVRYQSVNLDDALSRTDDIYFFVGHVNLVLGRRPLDVGFGRTGLDEKIIDFLPPIEIRGVQTREITESTVVAMYMNNRAAEALMRGQLDDAYAWAKGAIRQDPEFANSYNTLGVIYLHHHNPAEAERVFRATLERTPDNAHVMANLTRVLNDLGRVAEAQELARKLERIEPNPPFAFYMRGLKAMREGDYKLARDMFAKEVDRAPYYHEFRFWLAFAYLGLGEVDPARKELGLAVEYSTTRKDHDLYSTKLEKLSHYRAR